MSGWEEVLNDLVHTRRRGDGRPHPGADRRALATLSPRERTCVVLRFYEDLTVPAIAADLSLSVGTVKRYLSDPVRRLEGALGPAPDSHLQEFDEPAQRSQR